MDNFNSNPNDTQLSQELTRGRRGRAGDTVLRILGAIVIGIGLLSGPSLVLILLGAAIAGFGQWLAGRSRDNVSRQAYDAIVPELLKEVFGNDIKADPSGQISAVEESGIPLPKHDRLYGSGSVFGRYQGLPTQLCTIRLTDESEFQREETGLWEKNEHEIYTGQWLVCELGVSLSTGFTIWPRGKLDKLFRTQSIQTGNERFDRRFLLSCDDTAFALGYLNEARLQRFLALAEQSFGGVSVCLQSSGRLYIAVQSGHGFFELGKGREDAGALRARFSRELHWFTDMIDVFRLGSGT